MRVTCPPRAALTRVSDSSLSRRTVGRKPRCVASPSADAPESKSGNVHAPYAVAAGTKPIVMCHISHVYPAGASLYFTVVAALTTDPVAQWTTAKDAASRAIAAAGGTISHHHAVGRDHRPYLEDEIGPLGIEVLRAVKATLDPTGIMNPGVLVPPAAASRVDGAVP